MGAASGLDQYSAQIACFGSDLKFIESKDVLDYEVRKIYQKFTVTSIILLYNIYFKFVLAYERLFDFLYHSPEMLAQILAECRLLSDHIDGDHLNIITDILFNTIFANAINDRDLEMVLEFLRNLFTIDMESTDSPLQLLPINKSPFIRLYHCLIDSLLSAKIFLTATLYEPIMNLLSKTNMYLNDDAPNTLVR